VKLPRWLTPLSLAALGAALLLGLLAHRFQSAPLLAAAGWLAPLGTLWTHALQMVVIPLVLVNLLLAIAGHADGRTVGRLGALTGAVFVVLLLAGGLLAALVVPAVLARVPVDALSLGAAAHAAVPAVEKVPTFADVVLGLVPVNPVAAAANGELLPLMVFTVLFALGLNRVRTESRRPLIDVTRAASEAIFVVLRWVLLVTPAGVFCLTFPVAAATGRASAGAVGLFVALVIGLMIALTVALYAVAWLVGGVGPLRFARAVAPAQVVGITTRSSLASLPTLVVGAEQGLGLPARVTSLVLPLAVSTFKVNRTVSSTAKMLFLAHVYGVHLAPLQIAAFIGSVLLLSFTVLGVPSAGSIQSLPLYVALGIPIEGVMILNAVEAVPDVFKTLANVTGDMTAAAVVARFAGKSNVVRAAEPAAKSA